MHEQIQRQEDESQRVRQARDDLRAGLGSAISSLETYQRQVASREEVIAGLRKRVNTLEQKQAKNSHNSSLPPSSRKPSAMCIICAI